MFYVSIDIYCITLLFLFFRAKSTKINGVIESGVLLILEAPFESSQKKREIYAKSLRRHSVISIETVLRKQRNASEFQKIISCNEEF